MNAGFTIRINNIILSYSALESIIHLLVYDRVPVDTYVRAKRTLNILSIPNYQIE